MVFGNTGENSGSGVAFTRDPATGEKVFYGEFLINAQGEDVVAGVRTPEPVAKLKNADAEVLCRTDKVRKTLEKHFKDVQDSNSPFKRASCSCSRPAMANAPARPR